jgi:hypothetical protein
MTSNNATHHAEGACAFATALERGENCFLVAVIVSQRVTVHHREKDVDDCSVARLREVE